MKIIPLMLLLGIMTSCSEKSEFFKKNKNLDQSQTKEETKKEEDDSKENQKPNRGSEDESEDSEDKPVEFTEDKPSKPDVKPTKPEVRPTTPEVVVIPSKPEVKPTTPEVKPTKPEVKPTTPEVKPATPEVKPTTPVVNPTKPEVKPTVPVVIPSKPEVKPVDNNTNTISQTFNQVDNKMDIVWVIDNSASMRDEQRALAYNFKNFITNFIDEKVDFKMAITTTDAREGKKGVMVKGSELKLNSDAAQLSPAKFINDFMKMINVGTNGSGLEKGLETLDGFIGLNGEKFLRPDAYLIAIVVSDEEDQSPGTSESYAAKILKAKANPGLVKAYSIVDTKLSNIGAGTIATGFKRYAKLSELTNGQVYNITEDFDIILESIKKNLNGLLGGFALSHKPVAGSFEVLVDGRIEEDFQYDAKTGTIIFSKASLPRSGAKIKVTYKTLK